MSAPYIDYAKQLAELRKLPDRPAEWLRRSGWTMYTSCDPPKTKSKSKLLPLDHFTADPVPHPLEDIFVFDTEVMYNVSEYPVMAVAASAKAWYVWLSPWLVGESSSPKHLISLGDPTSHKLIVGHNIGYDRKRVQEEYHIRKSNWFFLDTMSLHIAANGMCSRQRPAWMSNRKKGSKSSAASSSSASATTATATPTTTTTIDPSTLDTEEPWVNLSSLNSLQEVARFHCNIDIDKSEREFFSSTDVDEITAKLSDLTAYCATDVDTTFQVYTKVWPLFLRVCPHPVSFGALRHLMSVFLPINSKWDSFLQAAEEKYNLAQSEIYDKLTTLANEAVTQPLDKVSSDPWLSQLDWTITPPRYTKKGVLMKNQKLPGKPAWYRDLFASAKAEMNISLRTRVAPILLRLQWDGNPLVWYDEHGWTFKAPYDSGDKYLNLNYTCVDETSTHKFFKIPHKDGPTARCTNPMAKGYVSSFEQGILTSSYDYAKSAVELNSTCSYWQSSRERILSQMPVYTAEGVDMGFMSQNESLGMILPKLIPMGTITRRAVEDTWLTASNAKKNRIGSELKSAITAPPGYTFVGADVDSEELWIASIIGDALFGIHGGTAVGWMTLEGTKAAKTDLHSKTAAILGIDRNQAKIFNYGRIYGAGLKFARQLLRQFNPLLSETDAKSTATSLYEQTKGVKTKSSLFNKGLPFWRGGTESILFNRLEEMAEQKLPRTPVLGASITQALLKENLKQTTFLTSRINWTIQSSGVDYLHLLIASMDHLCSTYNIDARLSITVHDEIRYLVKDEDVTRAALALQISNLWTRAMFCHQLGFDNVPQSVAFFSLIDIDHVLRKEVDLDCVTPSNPDPIPAGEAWTINDILAKCPEGLCPSSAEPMALPANVKPRRRAPVSERAIAYLAAQISTSVKEIRSVERTYRQSLELSLDDVHIDDSVLNRRPRPKSTSAKA